MTATKGQTPPSGVRGGGAEPAPLLCTPPPGFAPLGLPPHELTLEHTLPTGQSFRWRRTGDGEFTGVVGRRVVRAAGANAP